MFSVGAGADGDMLAVSRAFHVTDASAAGGRTTRAFAKVAKFFWG